jgi:hypothetical protein
MKTGEIRPCWEMDRVIFCIHPQRGRCVLWWGASDLLKAFGVNNYERTKIPALVGDLGGGLIGFLERGPGCFWGGGQPEGPAGG